MTNTTIKCYNSAGQIVKFRPRTHDEQRAYICFLWAHTQVTHYFIKSSNGERSFKFPLRTKKTVHALYMGYDRIPFYTRPISEKHRNSPLIGTWQ